MIATRSVVALVVALFVLSAVLTWARLTFGPL